MDWYWYQFETDSKSRITREIDAVEKTREFNDEEDENISGESIGGVPWVPEVLFFFREERAVKTERRKINLWSRRLWTSLPCKFGIRYLAKPVF